MFLNVKFLFSLITFSVCILKVSSQCSGVADGFYGDSQQCDRYIQCKGGQAVADELCGDGLVFNINKSPKTPACELPFGIDCSDRPYLRK
ncbi:uncharacterized protein B4U80_09537 [Leptotrombidium deliense]|uniref:Chitin-binding type-2 domain-containing protein n=1 Tax=Leptotrombidium deliense TaxID=299467 RepID=A0A443SG86_9ACAR|nr:uncharacterized protein B4U80_09537 [Leptotrombidium deliense]